MYYTHALRLYIKVLITKLRSANTVETRQYHKASKALLVLIPLLGITYLVVLAGPNEGMGLHIFAIARALLLSTQVNASSNVYIYEYCTSIARLYLLAISNDFIRQGNMCTFIGFLGGAVLLLSQLGSANGIAASVQPVERRAQHWAASTQSTSVSVHI